MLQLNANLPVINSRKLKVASHTAISQVCMNQLPRRLTAYEAIKKYFVITEFVFLIIKT